MNVRTSLHGQSPKKKVKMNDCLRLNLNAINKSSNVAQPKTSIPMNFYQQKSLASPGRRNASKDSNRSYGKKKCSLGPINNKK